MKYRYQLIVLGAYVEARNDILKQVEIEIENLNLAKEVIKIIDANSLDTEYSGGQPAFGLYFGDSLGHHKDVDKVEKLLLDGTMILPIFFKRFDSDIPSVLSNQNGIQYNKSQDIRIANIILEAFELLRGTRKIFISYRRSESTSYAVQLFEALEASNFDVFLDTHSIPKGEPFQDELWHRMTDSDVIVILNTKGFLERDWCKEEFAEACAKQIGIVQLIWPNLKIKEIEPSSHISYPTQLNEEDFIEGKYENNGRFTQNAIEKIIQEVESIRARNLAARQDNLITEFRNIAAKYGRKITVQPERILTEELIGGNTILYIPTIGIPQSVSCQSAEIKRKILGYDEISIRLIYDDLRIRDKWLKHLEWLNENFKKDIKTLKKREFETWLKKK